MRRKGGLLISIGAFLGLLVSLYNFFSPVGFLAPLSSIYWSEGAGLVVFSTLILLMAGIILASGVRHRGLVTFLMIGSLVDILGTGLAAYLLDSLVLLALMGLCLVGWWMRILSGSESKTNLHANAH